MLTAYELFYKAMKKYSGFGVACEWPYEPECETRIKSGEWFKQYWNMVLRMLDKLEIKTETEFSIKGEFTSKGKSTEQEKISMLQCAYFPTGYYVLVIEDFEERFWLKRCSNKVHCLNTLKEEKKNNELLFCALVVKV